MGLKSEQISVVIQGPVERRRFSAGLTTTVALIESLRRLLPNSPVILSTWAGQDVEDCAVDEVVYSVDPGPQGVWPGCTPNNVNRQIISTREGIKIVKTDYCLKIRSDIVLLSDDFISYFVNFRGIKSNLHVFEKVIISNNLSSRNSSSVLSRLPDHPVPFHPADHVHFGLTTDISALWDVPLQSDRDAYHFLDRAFPNRWRSNELSRLTPEQYISSNALSKFVDFEIEHYADNNPSTLQLSNDFLRQNFRFIPDSKFAIYFYKYESSFHRSFEWMRLNDER